MRQNIRIILWDNDGVLVNTERLYYQANRDILAQIDFELTVELYRDCYLKDNCGAWHLVQATGVSESQLLNLKMQRNELFLDLVSNEPIEIPGVELMLQELTSSFRMGVVTSAQREHVDLVHKRLCLRKHFEFVIAQGDYARSKPNPDPYLTAIQRAGVHPSECLVVEDSERGLIAAHAAGARCWVVINHLANGSDFGLAECCFDSVLDVGRALLA